MVEDQRYCYREVLPFIAMITVECTNVGLNTLFKAARRKGLSYYVFLSYSYAIATLILLPLPFIFRRSTDCTALPPLNLTILRQILLLGLIGYFGVMLGYIGISYSSPTLSSAMSNLTPAFTFILAVIFRMEKLALRSSETQAKIIGTIVSISGALVVVLYKGPAVVSSASPSSFVSPHLLQDSSENWVIGSLLFTAKYLLISVWNVLLTQIIKTYPAELVVVLLYNICAAVISATVGSIAETNSSSWRVTSDIALITIVYSGFLGSFFTTLVHTWGLHLKGPVYISIFSPLSIAIAAAMGAIFLGDILHIGSVIGAVIISVGFYAVMWGKANEYIGEHRLLV